MPLFGRRSRSVSVVRPTTPSNNSPAMMAASQAFLGSQTPPGRLATGAAAAALRSMSPASTPVGQIQTKRMANRQSSVGGRVSDAPRGRSVGSLQRRSSASSMSDRTFRAESPGRPATSSGVPISRTTNEPPVPKIPVDLVDVPRIPVKSHRRSMSIDDMQTNKPVNGSKLTDRNSIAVTTSNAPSRPAKGAVTTTPTRPTASTPQKTAVNPASVAAKKVTSLQNSPSLERIDSNGSHNFSYPGRARPQSPPPQRQSFDTGPRVPLNSTASTVAPKDLSQTEARQIQHKVAQAAQTPVKKRKATEGPLNEGSRLHTGTMGSKPIVTPLAPGPELERSSPDVPARGINNAKITGEATHFPPSPTSPTDSKGSDSESERAQRRAKRASGALAKQPSVVREDWEGEQNMSPPTADQSPAVAPKSGKRASVPTEANVSRKIESNAVPSTPVDSTMVPDKLTTPTARNHSLSPSRSARFSNRLSADMTDAQKHEPPPRSISPRKSALKHSPQILPLDTSRNRDASQTPSEATDISLEGSGRKKKNAHVKFDATPAVVGIAADTASPISPQIASPQKKPGKKWFQKTARVRLDEDSDDEDIMQPRPQLPTFGSVRGDRRNQTDTTPNPRSISPSSSSSSLSVDTMPTTMNTSISSDHALGAVIARDAAQKNAMGSSPVPPEVTTVEGSGMHSDTDSIYSQDERSASASKKDTGPTVFHARTTAEVTDDRAPTRDQLSKDDADLPGIAVLPPTPGTEEEAAHKDQWIVDLPGGFPGQDTDDGPNTQSTQHVRRPSHEIHDSVMPAIQEEDSDKDSVYSDAAEEQSEPEGDGFGSINAIVRSPVSPTLDSSPPESPVTAVPQRDVQSDLMKSDWADTSARWKTNREAAQKSSLEPAVTFNGSTSSAQTNKGIPQTRPTDSPASSISTNITPVATPTPSATSRLDRSQGGFKKSMRSGPVGPTTTAAERSASPDLPKPLKSSLRNSTASTTGQQALKSSLRSTPSSVPAKTSNQSAPKTAAPIIGQAAVRQSIHGAVSPQTKATTGQAPKEPRGALQKKNLRASAPPPARPPQVIMDDDSESDSSFRRRRRNKANASGTRTMRSSMRSGPPQTAPVSAPVTSRRDVRSMSPVRRRPFSPAGGESGIRTTLRGSRDDTPTMRSSRDEGPTLRGSQNQGKRSSSLFGRSRAKSPARKGGLSGPRSKFAVDSDDEKDRGPGRYTSRFADSSDEEENLRPVRGIPRRHRDDDSTDLEDSSDDEARYRSRPERKEVSIAVPTPPQIPNRPMSPNSEAKKRRGLFGRLRKNKDDPTRPASPLPAPNSDLFTTKSPSRATPHTTDPETAALMEFARRKLEAEGAVTAEVARPPSARPQSPVGGKLQRRMTPNRVMSDSWPLPPKIPDDEITDTRPVTSDGAALVRPPLGERQVSTATAATSATSPVDGGKATKKKRFPMLRKAFRLKD